MGPLNVNINDSVEPMERNVRATIPELEAELILMVRDFQYTVEPSYNVLKWSQGIGTL